MGIEVTGKGRPRRGTPLTPAEKAQRKEAAKRSPWAGMGRMVKKWGKP